MLMRSGFAAVLLSTVALHACSSNESSGPGNGGQPPASQYAVVEAFPGLLFDQPVDLQNAGDGSGRLFVVEQPGRIRVFAGSEPTSPQVFLDIRSKVNDAGWEEGLLGLAFHPEYPDSPYYYVYYTLVENSQRKSRVERYTVDPQDQNTTRSGSGVDIISIDQPWDNHNGGQIAFGPDGYLYVGVGDGGSANDPQNNGQNRQTLLGSILRIDVNTPPYGIPADNPFAGNSSGYREEIFAYGLRNPWRFSFDPVTQWLWVGDVGQNAWEEIDIVSKGGNYGWKIMEGTHCRPPTQGCDTTGLELPIREYAHEGGGRSITGGHVYRGKALPGLIGWYLYADFLTGEIWALHYDGNGPPENERIARLNNVASFGVDESGELYLCAIGGRIYRITAE